MWVPRVTNPKKTQSRLGQRFKPALNCVTKQLQAEGNFPKCFGLILHIRVWRSPREYLRFVDWWLQCKASYQVRGHLVYVSQSNQGHVALANQNIIHLAVSLFRLWGEAALIATRISYDNWRKCEEIQSVVFDVIFFFSLTLFFFGWRRLAACQCWQCVPCNCFCLCSKAALA